MFRRILVPLDGSATSERGLSLAIELALGQKEKVHLIFLHVVDDYAMLIEMTSIVNYEDMFQSLQLLGENLLLKAKHAAESFGLSAEVLLREVSGRRVEDVILDVADGVLLPKPVESGKGKPALKTPALVSKKSTQVLALEKKSCDLIVMGAHGRSSLNRFALGGVAQRVAIHSRPPVLLVRLQDSL
jgi:nucleotide-binding universal stress UspA family protein